MREQRVVLEPFGLSEILQCSGVVCANQHGFMMIKGYMKKEKEGEYLKLLGSSVWASVMVYDEWGKAGVLFTGVVTDGEISVENGLKTLKVKIKTGSFLMDLETHIRTFQSPGCTYDEIFASFGASYQEYGYIMEEGNRKSINRFLCQYQETDWRFLKRMASQLGLPLVPDTSYYYPRFYLGLPEGEKRELGEIISCDLCFDGRYYAVSGKCLVDREDFICYDVVTRTSLSLGDRVTYEGRELLVSRKKTELAGGEVIFTYRLVGNSYTWVPWENNPDYTGLPCRECRISWHCMQKGHPVFV